jgi:hypothetical protein
MQLPVLLVVPGPLLNRALRLVEYARLPQTAIQPCLLAWLEVCIYCVFHTSAGAGAGCGVGGGSGVCAGGWAGVACGGYSEEGEFAEGWEENSGVGGVADIGGCAVSCDICVDAGAGELYSGIFVSQEDAVSIGE